MPVAGVLRCQSPVYAVRGKSGTHVGVVSHVIRVVVVHKIETADREVDEESQGEQDRRDGDQTGGRGRLGFWLHLVDSQKGADESYFGRCHFDAEKKVRASLGLTG